jgi:predicted nuclease with TOPRIM domain
MSEQATSTDPRASAGQTNAELREKLARQDEEILRLRDLLISKDVELGAVKGRLAELDDRSARLASLATRIENRVPGLGRLVGAAVRAMRSQRR